MKFGLAFISAGPFLFCNYFKAVKLVGLLPTSHLYPVINAAPDSNVNLHEAKPLTLNMEFEMTRPMLDFLIRLHKNGDKPYDEVKVANSQSKNYIEHSKHL